MNSLQPIRIDNLDSGKFLEDVNEALQRAAEDIERRPLIQKPRTVSIEIALDPETQVLTDGRSHTVIYVHPKFKTSLPGTRGLSQAASFQTDQETGEIRLMVNVDFPEELNPQQTNILDMQTKKGA